MGLFERFMKKEIEDDFVPQNVSGAVQEGSYLDDLTYIRAIQHSQNGNVWHQYDVALDARPYGWEDMIKWADYMAEADLKLITQVSICNVGAKDYDITKEYNSNNKRCEGLLELRTEYGMLGMAGISKIINAPMKIVWINQTNTLRIFTTGSDENLIKKYAESVVRRNFGTKDAMKLGKNGRM